MRHPDLWGRRSNRIIRAVLVVEFERESLDPSIPSSAMLVNQERNGECAITWEEDHTWDGFGGRIPLGRPRRHDVSLKGSGDVTFYEDADSLFGQWRGAPQQPQPPAIGPAQPTLEEGT